ncbi:MAG TPA: glutathione S-transferase family protein [Thermoleophilaceae bacterium]|nr:glutathione S-transferase family protein [Thermoleophilaceae bacterium]
MGIPILWHLDISHFNEKVRWALDYKRIPHERRSVFPGMQEVRARLLRGGTTTLPVIDIDGKKIGDSTRIIEELERRWPDPPLYPSDPEQRRAALALEDFFDEQCAHELRRVLFDPLLHHPELMAEATGSDRRRGGSVLGLVFPVVNRAVRHKYAVTPERAAEGRAKVIAAFDRIEAERGSSGYLVGDSFTVADVTAAAVFSPLVCPPEFPYHQVEPERWPEELRSWRAALADRPGFRYVLDMYARHRGTSAEAAAA